MVGVILAVAGAALVWFRSEPAAAQVSTRDAVIDVQDGPNRNQANQLDATMYVPEQTPAPAILLAHGFGGSKDSVQQEARELAERGFTVLAYSARGFGRSTGEIALNSPDYEVADAGQLIDWLARQPEVELDGQNDPKLGVTGASYGGALSLLLAGTDERVDAIAPMITYNDLEQALVPNAGTTAELPNTPAAGAFADNGVFKQSWAGVFFSQGLGGASVGSPRSEAPEADGTTDDESGSAGGSDTASPPGPAPGPSPPAATEQLGPCGRFLPEICAAYTELATTGEASEQTKQLLRSRSPAAVTENIDIPTLLVQGEQDTLFGLDQADATARQITEAGGTVRTVWYAGGHDGGAPGPSLRGKVADWFTARLVDERPAEGGFEYDVEGALRAQGSPSIRTVTAPEYPGLTGSDATSLQTVPLRGQEQAVVNPPGGNPASISSIPGLNSLVTSSSRIADQLAVDLPGQSAQFTSAELDNQLLVTGSAQVRLRVAAADQNSAADGAVLFAKLYDVGSNGTRVLPGSAVAPIRIDELPADGSPVDVTVTLPGIVRPVESGQRLQLSVTTTDQAYANSANPASYRISLADDQSIQVPTVRGETSSGQSPTGALIGIGVTLGIGALAAVLGVLRRRARGKDVAERTDLPLVIENLSKAYPGGLTAVDQLSFSVEPGQVLGLLGPNGAGKTTTLRMLMGLISPTEGTIRVFGHLAGPGAPVLSRIGSFVEGAGFLPHLSGQANLELFWAGTGRPTEQAHFAEALEIAGLGDAVHRKVRTYSQGMRQRLAIAQAMLGLPDLLVLDEPTNGLDPPQIHQMREVLRQYASTGRTVVVSSHLLAEVEQTCSHVVVMHRGRLIAEGPVNEVTAGGGAATFRVDDTAAASAVLSRLDGVQDVVTEADQVHAELGDTSRAEAVRELVGEGVAVHQAGPRRRLEDAFLQLVGEETEG
nr:alpha/beta fold hydrolase [Tamaricihabitans halophyticus]